MIDKNHIRNLTEAALLEKPNHFVVDIKVSASNAIKVFIDCDSFVSIDDCVLVSRFIEKNLDRDKEDFELEVSSPGMDQPFKVLRQYTKNIGRKVRVVDVNGQEFKGELKKATDDHIEIETETSNKKAKSIERKLVIIPLHQIKETKKIITFK